MRALVGLLLLVSASGCAASSDEGPPGSSGGTSGSSGSGGSGGLSTDSGFPGGTAGTSGGSGGATGGAAGASTGGSAGLGGSGSTGGAGNGCPHPPVNDPSADDSALPPGPIVKFTVHVYYYKRPPNDETITPVEQNGKWMALVGDKIVFDATQKNADNKPCQWDNEPDYIVSDSCAFDRLATSNPFLLQMEAIAPGELTVSATIDGVVSNEVVVAATPP